MAKPHDNAYKYLFKNPGIFMQLLHSFVHEDFVKNLSVSDIHPVDKSFVSEELLDREADLIYRVNINGSENYIYVLIEFQSSADKAIPVRMCSYILLLYAEIYKKSKRGLLPNVFPLLLYNGTDEWNVPFNLKDLIRKNIAERYIPSFEYFPIIMNDVPDEYLDRLHNLVAAVIQLEKAGDKKRLQLALEKITEYIRNEDPLDIKTWFVWVSKMFKSSIAPEQIEKTLE